MMLQGLRMLNMYMDSWGKDITNEVEQKQTKSKIIVSFECEALKADKAAEDHIRQFMPKLAGMDAVGWSTLGTREMNVKSPSVEGWSTLGTREMNVQSVSETMKPYEKNCVTALITSDLMESQYWRLNRMWSKGCRFDLFLS
uniref:Uncharacterized protein n=1 Tax=Chenopodium quinoa TaxID=63459 RepID=A0A803LSG1_CHEQI